MSTDHIELTTEEILQACADASHPVTVTQLGRWAHYGLIDPPRRKGLGRGKGSLWLWRADCLPCVLLIAQLVEGRRGSLHEAASMLAQVGYEPRPDRLREVLQDWLDKFVRFATKRQTYMGADISDEDKAKGLTRTLRAKTHDLPEPLVARLDAFDHAIWGVEKVGDGSTANERAPLMSKYVSVPALRTLLETVDEATLMSAYATAGRILQYQFSRLLTVANLILLPLLRQRLARFSPSTVPTFPERLDLEPLVQDVRQEGDRVIVTPGNPAGVFRLYMTILMVAYKVHGVRMILASVGIVMGLAKTFITYMRESGQSRDELDTEDALLDDLIEEVASAIETEAKK
jgi:hypothetical protein